MPSSACSSALFDHDRHNDNTMLGKSRPTPLLRAPLHNSRLGSHTVSPQYQFLTTEMEETMVYFVTHSMGTSSDTSNFKRLRPVGDFGTEQSDKRVANGSYDIGFFPYFTREGEDLRINIQNERFALIRITDNSVLVDQSPMKPIFAIEWLLGQLVSKKVLPEGVDVHECQCADRPKTFKPYYLGSPSQQFIACVRYYEDLDRLPVPIFLETDWEKNILRHLPDRKHIFGIICNKDGREIVFTITDRNRTIVTSQVLSIKDVVLCSTNLAYICENHRKGQLQDAPECKAPDSVSCAICNTWVPEGYEYLAPSSSPPARYLFRGLDPSARDYYQLAWEVKPYTLSREERPEEMNFPIPMMEIQPDLEMVGSWEKKDSILVPLCQLPQLSLKLKALIELVHYISQNPEHTIRNTIKSLSPVNILCDPGLSSTPSDFKTFKEVVPNPFLDENKYERLDCYRFYAQILLTDTSPRANVQHLWQTIIWIAAYCVYNPGLPLGHPGRWYERSDRMGIIVARAHFIQYLQDQNTESAQQFFQLLSDVEKNRLLGTVRIISFLSSKNFASQAGEVEVAQPEATGIDLTGPTVVLTPHSHTSYDFQSSFNIGLLYDPGSPFVGNVQATPMSGFETRSDDSHTPRVGVLERAQQKWGIEDMVGTGTAHTVEAPLFPPILYGSLSPTMSYDAIYKGLFSDLLEEMEDSSKPEIIEARNYEVAWTGRFHTIKDKLQELLPNDMPQINIKSSTQQSTTNVVQIGETDQSLRQQTADIVIIPEDVSNSLLNSSAGLSKILPEEVSSCVQLKHTFQQAEWDEHRFQLMQAFNVFVQCNDAKVADIGMMLLGERACLIYADAAGVAESPMYAVDEDEFSRRAFICQVVYLLMACTKWNWDPTKTWDRHRAMKSERATKVKQIEMPYPSNLGQSNLQKYTLEVEPEVRYRARYLRGRRTSVYSVKKRAPVDSEELETVKDYWPTARLGKEPREIQTWRSFSKACKEKDKEEASVKANLDHIQAFSIVNRTDIIRFFAGVPSMHIREQVRIHSGRSGTSLSLYDIGGAGPKFKTPVETVLGAIIGGAKGVIALHDLGIVHGDVSMANICIADDQGQDYLIDMGLGSTTASLFEPPSGNAVFMSLPRMRASKNAAAHKIQPLDDVESLLWVLYECVQWLNNLIESESQREELLTNEAREFRFLLERKTDLAEKGEFDSNMPQYLITEDPVDGFSKSHFWDDGKLLVENAQDVVDRIERMLESFKQSLVYGKNLEDSS